MLASYKITVVSPPIMDTVIVSFPDSVPEVVLGIAWGASISGKSLFNMSTHSWYCGLSVETCFWHIEQHLLFLTLLVVHYGSKINKITKTQRLSKLYMQYEQPIFMGLHNGAHTVPQPLPLCGPCSMVVSSLIIHNLITKAVVKLILTRRQ